jgi:hypothetical protein
VSISSPRLVVLVQLTIARGFVGSIIVGGIAGSKGKLIFGEDMQYNSQN